MSVVGLDVGSYSCYIAVAAGGRIDTVANEYSDRCTPAYVSMNEKNRCMGTAAKNQSTTNVKNTLSCFKRFLGRSFTDPQVQSEIKSYVKPYGVVEGKSGETLIQAHYMGEMQEFSPEQVMTMLLTKLKETAEHGLKTKDVDVVTSVPSYFTDVERKSMIAACQMAGLNCLKVMNDTTAVSLEYGIYKQDLPGEHAVSRNVVFIDIGYSSLQVVATSFNKGKLKVIAVVSDPNIGGRDFDTLLVNHFIEEWKTKYKINVLSNPKAYIRLTQECEKLKKLMSANTQQIPINIECFMDDKDVHGSMDRATFEGMAAPLLQRVENVFRKILEVSKLVPDDIYAVEVLGGSSRVPSIKDLVTKVFYKESSTTLNADEAVAKGCALQCAIISPTFRVRDFAILDCQPYPITVSWTNGGMEEDCLLEVFPEFHQTPFSKMLTFYRKEPFALEAKYSNPSQVPIKDAGIGMYTVKNVQPTANGESSKVKVKVRVNSNGIFNMQSASMIEKLDDKDQPESMEIDPKAAENGLTPSASDASMDTDPPQKEDQMPDPLESKGDTTPQTPAFEEKMIINIQYIQKKKKTTKSIDLPIEPMTSSYTKEAINLLIEKENQMIMQDRLEKERIDAKNTVEEYVYDMRDKLCGPLEHFCQEQIVKIASADAGSDEISELFCQPCADDGEHLPAEGYCTDCQDFLCTPCFAQHRKARLSKHHVLLDKSQMPKIKPTSTIDTCTEPCAQHKGEIISFYCKSHDQLACQRCVKIGHVGCKVSRLADVSDGIAQSPEYNELMNGLNGLEQKYNRTLILSKSQVKEIETYHSKAIEAIENIVTQFRDEDLKRMTAISDTSSTVIVEIQTLTTKLEALQRRNQNSQIFVEMRNVAHQMTMLKGTLSKVDADNTIRRYAFTKIDQIDSAEGTQNVVGQLVKLPVLQKTVTQAHGTDGRTLRQLKSVVTPVLHRSVPFEKD